MSIKPTPNSLKSMLKSRRKEKERTKMREKEIFLRSSEEATKTLSVSSI